jgi:SIR2-like domain
MQPNGLFAQVAPNGSVRVIERPEAIREPGTPETVVVKLNGGIVLGEEPPESVVIASGQFERLAATLPDALPEWVRAVLRDRSLLFLGHGLAGPDVIG